MSQQPVDAHKRGRGGDDSHAAAADKSQQKRARAHEDQRQRPPPLTRLADVEVQLVMQLLGMRSRLRLARCSRQLRHAASHPFAWQEGAMYTITKGQLLRSAGNGNVLTGSTEKLQARVARISSSLLRHCPIRVEWFVYTASDVTAAALACVPNLRAVRSSGSSNNEAGWRQLIAHPAAQHLWEIDAYWYPLPEDVQQLAQLPQLYKLGFRTYIPDATLLVPLIRAPVLTDFRLDFSPADRELHLPQLAVIAQLPLLRRLKLSGVDFKQGELHTLLGGPGLSRTLECLHLVSVGLQQDTTADAGAFAAMSQLHTVIVEDMRGDVAHLLPLLAIAPALRRLELDCATAPHASVASLRSLLQAVPQLLVTIPLLHDHHFDPSLILHLMDLARDSSRVLGVTDTLETLRIAALEDVSDRDDDADFLY